MSEYWTTCELADFLEDVAVQICNLTVDIFVNKYSGKCYGETRFIVADGKSFEEIEKAFKTTVEMFVNPKYFIIDTCKFIREDKSEDGFISPTSGKMYCVKPYVKIMSNTARKK